MSQKIPETIPNSCAECNYYKKTGLIDMHKGHCNFYDQKVYTSYQCIALGLLTDEEKCLRGLIRPKQDEENNLRSLIKPKQDEDNLIEGSIAKEHKQSENSIVASLVVLLISCAYTLFLIFRIKSILGTYVLVIFTNNNFDADVIKLGTGGLIVLWLVAIGGIVSGIIMIVKYLQRGSLSSYQNRKTKKCPRCAELILAEAKVCKHCGNEFND